MTLTPVSSQPATHRAAAARTLAPVRVRYSQAALDALFGDDVLAVIGFGDGAPATHADPRYLRVALEPLGEPCFEVWHGSGTVRSTRRGGLTLTCDDDYEFGHVALDEAAHGSLAAVAQAMYTELAAHFAAAQAWQPLRIWNYLDAINDGDGDDERYRHFCSGRAAGMRHGFAQGYPAATAIGVRDGRRTLQVYWLAARASGEAIENPRQMNAWRYPRQYGPEAPTFARAMRAPTQAAQVYLSGTAAIVGHASRHHDDFAAQVSETLANIDSVLGAAGLAPAQRLGADALLKAYVRRDGDLAAARALLAGGATASTPTLFLAGDICRRELLIEIDGVQGAQAT